MKTLWLTGIALALDGSAGARDIEYEVHYQDVVVATQRVSVSESADQFTIRSKFEAELPVFVSLHHYAENQSVTFRRDGAVLEFNAHTEDGRMSLDVQGTTWTDGVLRVVRQTAGGVTTNLINRGDYDLNSLVLYAGDPETFVTTNHAPRVLRVDDGEIVPSAVELISESETFERQNRFVRHAIWTDGAFQSHSWHPERKDFIPSRYIRHSRAGEFTFERVR